MSNQPALSELQQLPGILEASELGNNRFRFRFNGDREVMQKMIEWSVSRNWGLSEITLEKISLDEIFAQLSGKRKQKA
jgi:ABC-2 type transport system ATP-binding protein